MRIPRALTRAFADDIAAVIRTVSDLSLVLEEFANFRRLSGLSLNLGKTQVVPLSGHSLDSFRETLVAAGIDSARDTLLVWAAKYLGVMFGPGAADPEVFLA